MHIKLKGSPGVYIVGFMGCGKSTVGRALGRKWDWPFVDLDDEVERRAGKQIAAIFDDDGEDAFREYEHQAVIAQAELARGGQPRVVALGGGTFVYERNRHVLQPAGLSIWLDADVDKLWARIALQGHRPLARNRDAYEALLESRREHYAKADVRIDADGSPQEVLDRIFALELL